MADPFAAFDPVVRGWFRARYGAPTAVQSAAWAAIARGEHVLATAPTGGGKTLAAFLWAIDGLVAGRWPLGTTRVLYVSPLKALGNDVQRNLLGPLAELRAAFAAAGRAAPEIRVAVRSGDTPPAERQRLLRKPPEILVTTPESLTLMLLSAAGRAALAGVATLVLDEIHAVAGEKRGAFQMSAVERLAEIAGEFQRVALSATVRPLERIAAFVGGRHLVDGDHVARPVTIVAPPATKRVTLRVHAVPQPDEGAVGEEFWAALTVELRRVIAANRATLVFCNSRRLTEKLARFLNDGAAEPIAYAHHGSLARELRAEVEDRLKRGALKAVVATGSLELGIDVGEIDEVVLVQTPPSLSQAIQRVGRAGHSVGVESRGRIYPTHAGDLLIAAASAPLVEAGAGEPIAPPRAPLDVLAQAVVTMCAVAPAHADELFARVRCCDAWRELTRGAFDLVLAMLVGRWRGTRLRELAPRLRRRADGRLGASEAATPLLRMSGGVIPDRGYFAIRVPGSGGRDGKGAKIGELDEEFVWERHVGDTFAFGAQSWRITAIGDEAVEVAPSPRASAMAPFWRADADDRGGGAARAAGELIARLEPRLGDDAVIAAVALDQRCEPEAARRLVEHLRRCRASLGALPHARRVVVETCPEPGGDGVRVIVHAPWGGRALRPWALALAQAWRARDGTTPSVESTEQAVMLRLAAPIAARELMRLVAPEQVERLVRARLPITGFFGARFRECAARALLLPRSGPRKRTPLWLTRTRAKRLLQAVGESGEFPIVAEAWRECLEDRFDLAALAERLAAVEDGAIAVAEIAHDEPSPLAADLVWRATNSAMYDDDTPADAAAPLAERVLADVVAGRSERPRVPRTALDELAAKLARTAPGYAPGDADGLVDLVAERLLLPEADWRALAAAMRRDHGVDWPGADPRLARVALGDGAALVARDDLAAVDALRGADDAAFADVLGRILAARAALTADELAELTGAPRQRIDAALAALGSRGAIVSAALIDGDDRVQVIDAAQYARLLRIARAARRPRLAALPAARLPWFLARWQRLVPRGDGVDGVRDALAPLVGACLPAGSWESEVLPARVRGYQPAWLDALIEDGAVAWHGCGDERLGFAGPDAHALFTHPEPADDAEDAALFARLWSTPGARFDLLGLSASAGEDSAAMTRRLWRWAWQGRVVNDGFAVVRQGLRAGFVPADIASAPRARHGLRAWTGTRPLAGAWRALDAPPERDRVAAAEADKERARQLIARYGVVFRELCAHEPPALQWGRLLPALRLIELAGEIAAGHFIDGPAGLQFAAPDAVELLRDGAAVDPEAWWWHHATDPASTCGLGLPGAAPAPRHAGTFVVWRGDTVAAIARRGGRQLDLRLGADDALALTRLFAVFAERLARAIDAPRALVVETINDEPAARSGHRAAFIAAGFYVDGAALALRRSFG